MLGKLFQPISIGNVEIPNRIVFPPIGTGLAEDGGGVSDAMVAYYASRARGGAGLIVVEYSAVDEQRYSSRHQLRISNDSCIPGLRWLALTIKSHGARAAIQIHHPGRQNYSSVTGLTPIAPSAIPCPRIKEMPRELSVDEIEVLIDEYAAAALRAREAGFDAVELHGAHGYLICQFLSPYSNKRQDEYGGDTARRARFALEIIRRAKQMAGADFPVILRFSGDEHVPGGLAAVESREIAKLAVEGGADAIDISAGNYATPQWMIQPQFWSRGCLAPLAAAIKPAVRVPLVIAGRINDGVVAERILQEGAADLVSMGRALIADPELPRRVREGQGKIHRCIACNTCMDRVFRMVPMRCLINPDLGSEGQSKAQATEPKRVLVLGGGPAGMEAARVARQRGHEVSLWDEAARPDGRWSFLVGGFVKDRLQRLREAAVAVELGRSVTVEAVCEAKPDAVLVSPSLVQLPAPFLAGSPVVGGPIVVSVEQALEAAPDGKRAAVVGAHSGAFEVADLLIKRGVTVTMIPLSAKVGTGIESITRQVVLDKMREDGLLLRSEVVAVELAAGGLSLKLPDGTQEPLDADFVVLATGYRRDETLVASLRAAGLDARPLPACESPRWIIEAMEEAAAIALGL